MKTLHVKPAEPGSIVRDPDNMRPLPPEGDAVRDTPIWHRRLGRNEVVKTSPEAIAKGKAAREAAERPAAAEAEIAAETAPRRTKTTAPAKE